MSEMTKDEIRNFLLQGTFTGKLGTINKNGSPHIVPIWFTLDNKDHILFTTGDTSVKAKNIQRDNRVRLCIDDQVPLFSFVTIDGIAEIISNKSTEIYKWAKIKATKVIGQKDIAGW